METKEIAATQPIEFLQNLLNRMILAEEQCEDSETQRVLNRFIGTIGGFITEHMSVPQFSRRKIGGRRSSNPLELLENAERLEHALKNIQICIGDASRVAEICKKSLSGEFYP